MRFFFYLYTGFLIRTSPSLCEERWGPETPDSGRWLRWGQKYLEFGIQLLKTKAPVGAGTIKKNLTDEYHFKEKHYMQWQFLTANSKFTLTQILISI